jgi:arylsulfatase A-like enzyme
VDRLAAEGTKFTHAFVTAPVCSPCRSALITGMYQTTIGAHHHRSGRGEQKIHLPEGVRPLPELFQDAGYFTCIGNGLNEAATTVRNRRAAQKDAQGPAQSAALGKTDYNFEWDPAMYDAADWSQRDADQPFFMQVQLAGGKLRGGTDQAAIKLSQRAEKELGGAVSPDKVTLPPYYPRDPVLLRDWAAYLDAVRFTDQHVGKVLTRLEEEGLLEDTLVVFMTDHGISHARGKQFLYNEGTHVPVVVRPPKNFEKLVARIPVGGVRDDLIQHIDVAALSLAAAGITIPSRIKGDDVFSPEYFARSYVFAARDRCDETIERIRSVRTARFLYIRNFYPERPHLQPNAYKDGKSIIKALRELHATHQLDELSERLLFSPTRPAEELYDWLEDPWQTKNLIGVAKYAYIHRQNVETLELWMHMTQDQGPESEAMYDSDMAVYVGSGNSVVEQNIALMKKWHWPKTQTP